MNLTTRKGRVRQMRKPPVRLLTVDQFAEATGWKPATVRQKMWLRELPT
jgi:hypothetical protein